jgi:hypothetical protein
MEHGQPQLELAQYTHQALLATMAVVDLVEVITSIQLQLDMEAEDLVEYRQRQELMQQVEMV